MPDWTYHTFLRPVVARVPRRFLRAWGASRAGRAVVRFMADAPPDARIAARASDDTRGIVLSLGVSAIDNSRRATADPGAAARELRATGRVVLDVAAGGPGLPKRVSEATLVTHPAPTVARRWGLLLLGVGMIVAGLVAGVVGATRVILPYDEAYVTIPRELLPFLGHDRVTLAGTMVSIGILYAALAWGAPGAPWARRAIGISAGIGFASFFLFFAYGYFDPLHAAISLALFPFFVWGVWPAPPGPRNVGVPDLANDAAWRRAQWGTLGLVAIGMGLAVGGATIAIIGSTRVFVASDLAFIGPMAVPARLTSLVAHDRAGFGGALVSTASSSRSSPCGGSGGGILAVVGVPCRRSRGLRRIAGRAHRGRLSRCLPSGAPGAGRRAVARELGGASGLHAGSRDALG